MFLEVFSSSYVTTGSTRSKFGFCNSLSRRLEMMMMKLTADDEMSATN